MDLPYRCSSCGRSFDINNVYDQGGGAVICKDCYSQQTAAAQPAQQGAGQFRCVSCGGEFAGDRVYDQGGGSYICHGCYARSAQAGPYSMNYAVSQPSTGKGLIIWGYVCCGVSLLFCPIGFGIAGLVIGIINPTFALHPDSRRFSRIFPRLAGASADSAGKTAVVKTFHLESPPAVLR